MDQGHRSGSHNGKDGRTGSQKQIRKAVADENRQQAVEYVNQYFSSGGFTEIRARSLMVCSPPVVYTDFYYPNKEAGVVKEAAGLSSFGKCVRRLEAYATNLLKPAGTRSKWKNIQYADGDYPALISMYMGNDVILKLLGYQETEKGFVYPSRDTVSKEKVLDVATDLLILDVILTNLSDRVLGEHSSAEPKEVRPVLERQTPVKTKSVENAQKEEFCAICGDPAKYKGCDEVDCKGQAWCNNCNERWHVNNPTRNKHQFTVIEKKGPVKSAVDFLKGVFGFGQDDQRDVTASLESSIRDHGAPLQQYPDIPQTAHSTAAAMDRGISPSSLPHPEYTHEYSSSSRYSHYGMEAGYQAPVSPIRPPRRNDNALRQHQPARSSSESPDSAQTYQSSIPKTPLNFSTNAYSGDAPGSHSTKPVPQPRQRPLSSLQMTDDLPAFTGVCKTQAAQIYSRIMENVASGTRTLEQEVDENKWQINQLQPELDKMNDNPAGYASIKTEIDARRDVARQLNKRKTSHKPTVNHASGRERPMAEHPHEPATHGAPMEKGAEYETAESIEKDAAEAKRLRESSLEQIDPLKSVHAAIAAGFTVNEIGLAAWRVDCKELLHWLHTDYNGLCEDVQREMQNISPNVHYSKKEIRMSLVEGDAKRDPKNLVESMAQRCADRRQEVVDTVMRLYRMDNVAGSISEKDIHQRLLACSGEIEALYFGLNEKVLESARANIWNDLDENELVKVEGDKLVRRQSVILFGDVKTSAQHRKRIAYSEFGLQEIAIDEAIHFLDNRQTKYSGWSVEVEDVISAVVNAGSVRNFHRAVEQYLNHECSVCYRILPAGNMASLPCHGEGVKECCKECAKQHFEHAIRSQAVVGINCPMTECHMPDKVINDREKASDFFENLLNITFPALEINKELIDSYNQKLAEWNLQSDPQFVYCQNNGCRQGFLTGGAQRAACPGCNVPMCSKCLNAWEDQHKNMSCKDFAQWKRDNDPKYQQEGLEAHLRRTGIRCPKCTQKYELAKGGCMHFTCTQCKHEFCGGCGATTTKACPRSAELNCNAKGLHSHCPRNCLSFLRDESVENLETLLDNNSKVYKKDAGTQPQCVVDLQAEQDGLKMDAKCGAKVIAGDLCEKHYKEYLVGEINFHKLDPVTLLDVPKLLALFAREKKAPPPNEQLGVDEYKGLLVNAIKKQFALPDLSGITPR